MPQQITQTIMLFGKPTPVTVTVHWNGGLSKSDEKLIVETVTGQKSLHQTSKSKGCPITAIGYMHNYGDNTLYAVSAMNQTEGAYSITIVAEGQVKAGVHRF